MKDFTLITQCKHEECGVEARYILEGCKAKPNPDDMDIWCLICKSDVEITLLDGIHRDEEDLEDDELEE